jgi:class 3 adenylate cyclase
MAFGQLGAVIIRENVTSGDGQLEVMIPGHRINVIFMVVRVNDFVPIANTLGQKTTQFLNKIVKILHECSDRWSGWANKNEGDKYLLTWKLPDIEEAENEKNEALQEQRTEYADKSLIAAVKIISEIRRSNDLEMYKMDPELIKATNSQQFKTNLTFGLHMGWTIEGVIGSESKSDACYLSPHLQISYRIEQLCQYYD